MLKTSIFWLKRCLCLIYPAAAFLITSCLVQLNQYILFLRYIKFIVFFIIVIATDISFIWVFCMIFTIKCFLGIVKKHCNITHILSVHKVHEELNKLLLKIVIGNNVCTFGRFNENFCSKLVKELLIYWLLKMFCS